MVNYSVERTAYQIGFLYTHKAHFKLKYQKMKVYYNWGIRGYNKALQCRKELLIKLNSIAKLY